MSNLTKTDLSQTKIGILGGGQLGKMLINAANKWSLNIFVLDPSDDCPAAYSCNTFVKGDFKNYDDVYSFGQLVDIITIEIENVNTDALIQLKKEGKIVYPEPEVLHIIKDKGLQKKVYVDNNFSTSNYNSYNNKQSLIDAIENKTQKFPFVQKSCKAGYDGKGVAVIKSKDDINKLLENDCIAEELIDIEKEISVIVAKNIDGDISVYDPTEMTFNAEANLVEFLISPAQINSKIKEEAQKLAIETIKAFNMTGILAVEMFLDKNNKLYINEVAPRAHNSGHQTIEACYTSQYEQQLRTILGLPLGSTKIISPSIMINLLGEKGFSGNTKYVGLDECSKIEGVNIHLYGKKETKPFRKMGHVTIIDNDIEKAKAKAIQVQKILKIIS